jgi:hypothetical protein
MGEGAREGGIEGQRLSDGKGEMGRDSMLQKAAELGAIVETAVGELELHRRRCRDGRARRSRARCFSFLFPGLHRYLFFSPMVLAQNKCNFSGLTGHPNSDFYVELKKNYGLIFIGVLGRVLGFQTCHRCPNGN